MKNTIGRHSAGRQPALLFLFLTFTLTSCFEIREEIDIKSNGSGTYTMTLDMSKSKNILDIAMSMAENEDKIPFAEIDSAFIKSAEALNKMEDISNAQGVKDKVNYIFTTKFDFKSVDALNDALNEMNKRKYPELESFPIVYKYENKVLERTSHFYMKGLTDFSEQTGGDEQKLAQIKALMQTAIYTSIIRTPEGKIKKFSNTKATLSDNKKELHLSVNLLEMAEGAVSLGNVLKTK